MKLRTLSPIHIGCGESYYTLDFYIHENRVFLLDGRQVVEELSKYGWKAIELTAQGKDKIENYINPEEYLKNQLELIGEFEGREIKRHIHSMDRPYIPGSSIKGSIRTAILWNKVREKKELLNYAINLIEQAVKKYKNNIPKRILKTLDDRLENKVFRGNSKSATRDFMKGLIVRDSGFFSAAVYEIQVLGTDLRIAAECIKPGQEAEIDIKFKGVDEELVRKSCKEFYTTIAEVELEYEYPKQTKEFFRRVKKKDLLLRVGYGSGWYSTTIGTLLREHPKFEYLRKKLGLGKNPINNRVSSRFPATRKITADFYPLGWIEIDG